MNISQFNHIESGVWFAIAALLVVKLFTKGVNSRFFQPLLLSAITFVVFGFSDVIEAHTGAWWRPWWLLIIKISCVFSLILCFAWYKQLNLKTSAESPKSTPQSDTPSKN